MEIALLVTYFVGLLIISLLFGRDSNDQSSFFLASRSLGTSQLTSSLAATTIGGSAVLLVLGQVFQQGLPFIWTDIAGGLGLIVLGVILARKVRATGCYSLPEIAGLHYGPGVRIVTTVLVVIAELGFLAILLRACAGILQPVIDIHPDATILIISGLFMLYTVIGGQKAVVKTDVLQILLTLAGLALLLFVTFSQQPDWGLLPPEHLSFPFSFNYPPVNIFSLILIAGLPHVVGSDIFGKVLCARDGDTAKRSAVLAGILKILAGILVGIIGLNAALLLPASTLPDSVLPELLIRYTDPLLATIIVIALLSTLMSSADSVLLTAATVVSRDLLGGDQLPSALHGRIMTVVVGLAGVMLTLQFPTILSAFFFAYTLFSASIVVPVLFGFWKEQLKLTRTGAVAAMSISAVLIIVLSILRTDSATVTIAGIIVNAVLLFGVSWLSNLFRSTGS